MSSVFPQIRLLGDKDGAAKYIRRGQNELFRLKERAKNDYTPVLQTEVNVDKYTTLVVSIYGGQEFIQITHLPPEFVEEVVEEKEEELEIPKCPPAFVVYKHEDLRHEIGFGDDFDGYVIAYNEAAKRWQQADPIDNFADSPNGGWYHLNKVYKNLNNPDNFAKCDRVTWYGNPNSFFDDQIWTDGSPAQSNNYLLQRFMWVGGKEVRCPEAVLGGCILPDEGTDYYYVLTNASDESDPNNQTGGADEKIWRKDVTKANHFTDDWTQIGTVPYTTYSTLSTATKWPLPITTAYVDEEGVAWLCKEIWQASPTRKEHVLLKINLKTTIHERIIGTDDHTCLYTKASTWDFEDNESSHYRAVNDPDYGNPFVYRNNGTENESATGEEYLFTMGGLEARYDLYAVINYEFDYLYEVTSTGGGTLGATSGDCTAGQQGIEYITYAEQQTSRLVELIELVIKKEDEEVWRGPLSEIPEKNLVGTKSTSMAQNPADGCEGIETTTKSSNNTIIPVYNYWYLFLHPHFLTDVVYYRREMLYTDQDPNYDITVSYSFYRGDMNDPELLQSYTGTKTNQSSGTNYYAPNNIANAIHIAHPGNPSSGSAGSSSAFTLLGTTTRGQYTFVTPSNLNPNLDLSGSGAGFAPVQGNFLTPETTIRPIACYNHTTEFVDDAYLPEFTGVVPWGKKYATLAILQTIYDAGPSQGTIDGFVSKTLFEPDDLIDAATFHDDVSSPTKLVYVLSQSADAWRTSHTYQQGELVFWFAGTSTGKKVVECTSTHLSAAGTEPFTGASWQTVWEQREDYGVYIATNTGLTLENIRDLVGEDNIWPLEIGIV